MKKKVTLVVIMTSLVTILMAGLMVGITFADHKNTHIVPEPVSCILFAAGGAVLYGAYRVRKKKKNQKY